MEEPENSLALVRRAAGRGARSVSSQPQVIADAIDVAVAQGEAAVIARKVIDDVARWAYQVAANAARKLGRRLSSVSSKELSASFDVLSIPDDADRSQREGARQKLRAKIGSMKKILAGRQFEVAMKLCQPEMSLHRAARELGMDRRSLRRSFQRALSRLQRA